MRNWSKGLYKEERSNGNTQKTRSATSVFLVFRIYFLCFQNFYLSLLGLFQQQFLFQLLKHLFLYFAVGGLSGSYTSVCCSSGFCTEIRETEKDKRIMFCAWIKLEYNKNYLFLLVHFHLGYIYNYNKIIYISFYININIILYN